MFWKSDKILEQELEKEITDLEAMLQMITPYTSIIINDEIGLIGEGIEESKEHIVTSRNISNAYKAFGGIRHIPLDAKKPEIKGETFRVLDSDGCIMIDYPVVHTGIIQDKKDRTVGYVFVLKGFKARDPFEDFFSYSLTSRAVVAYVDGKLYINNVDSEELLNKFELEENLKIEQTGPLAYTLTFKNKIYHSIDLDTYNNISIYKERKLRL